MGKAAKCEAGWSKCGRVECSDLRLWLWSVMLRGNEPSVKMNAPLCGGGHCTAQNDISTVFTQVCGRL